MKSAQYWLGYWDRAKELKLDYNLNNLIVDIQNDAIRGVGSTPVAKKSGTLPERNTAKAAPATLDPILAYNGSNLYVVEWDGYSEVFAAEPPNVNKYLSEQAETKAISALFVSGFRPVQPMIWVGEGRNKWVLVPRNEWKDDTTSDGPGLGVGYS
jgi:hypothetical protein